MILGCGWYPDVFHVSYGKSNFDFAEVSKNLVFLQSYRGENEILLADIDVAIPKTLQDNIFDLTQLVLQTKMDEAKPSCSGFTIARRGRNQVDCDYVN